MKRYFYLIFYFLLIYCILYTYGCNNNEIDKPDISKINVQLKFHRFDQALFSVKPDSIEQNIPKLENDYGDFFNLFCSRIINIGGTNNRNFIPFLQKFISDYNMLTVYNDCQNNFKNINGLTVRITIGFKYFKYYFPDKDIPEIYFYMGGFNQSIVTSNNVLGIGLDKYLGKNYSYYSRLGLAKYQCYKLQKQFIVADCFRAMAWSEFPFNDSVNDLIHNMLYQGKVQYFIDKMLPDIVDSIKFAYTKKQWDWCLQNENLMWSYLIDKKQLFITGEMDIKRYIDEAPFTTVFPHESPCRTGVWLGWRIVCNYMKKNPKVTLVQLMQETNYEKILDGSKYNP